MRLPIVILAAAALTSGVQAAGEEPDARIAGLDGAIVEAETADAKPIVDENGARVLMRDDDPYLWIRVLSEPAGVVSRCLAEGSTVTVLHASAALGMVRYEPAESGWALRGKFEWALRDKSLDPEARYARQQHLEQHGWVATTNGMGDPEVFEFLIRRDRLAGDGTRLAVGIMPMAPPNAVYGLPRAAAGDCAHDKLVKGPPPDELKFDTGSWLTLAPR